MKSLRRFVFPIVLLSAVTPHAQTQNLAGQWQGTLQVGKELRLVFVIAPTGQGNALSGTLYSIDQGAQGIAATVTVQGGTVRLSVAPLSISYEGKLAADGNSIAGTFVQGPGTLPLTLTRANKETAWALPAPPRTMAADAPTVFESPRSGRATPTRRGGG